MKKIILLFSIVSIFMLGGFMPSKELKAQGYDVPSIQIINITRGANQIDIEFNLDDSNSTIDSVQFNVNGGNYNTFVHNSGTNYLFVSNLDSFTGYTINIRVTYETASSGLQQITETINTTTKLIVPTSSTVFSDIGHSYVGGTFEVTDPSNALDNLVIKVNYNGNSKSFTTTDLAGNFIIENMEAGTPFTTEIILTYETWDSGLQQKVKTDDTVLNTRSGVTIGSNISVDRTSFTGNFIIDDKGNSIQDVYYTLDNVRYEADSPNTFSHSGLTPDTNYEVKLYVKYNTSSEIGVLQSKTFNITTQITEPSVTIDSIINGFERVDINYTLNDPDNTVSNILLNPSATSSSSGYIKIDNLNINSSYTYEMVIVYTKEGTNHYKYIDINFNTLKKPHINIYNITTNTNSYSLDYIVTPFDGSNIDISWRYDGGSFTTLNNLSGTITDTNLVTGDLYTPEIHVSYTDPFKTYYLFAYEDILIDFNAPSITITPDYIDYTEAGFSYSIQDPDNLIDTLAYVFKGVEYPLTNLNGTITLGGLISDTDYSLELKTVLNTYNNDVISKTHNFKTKRYQPPIVKIDSIEPTYYSVNIGYTLEDPNNLIETFTFIINGNNYSPTSGSLVVENLEPNTDYTIELQYTYDLGYGSGTISNTITDAFTTEERAPTIGERINDYFINAGFDNPFLRLFVAFAFIGFVSLVLAISNAPTTAIILSDIALIIAFIALGFFPSWIILVFGVVLMILTYVTLFHYIPKN